MKNFITGNYKRDMTERFCNGYSRVRERMMGQRRKFSGRARTPEVSNIIMTTTTSAVATSSDGKYVVLDDLTKLIKLTAGMYS